MRMRTVGDFSGDLPGDPGSEAQEDEEQVNPEVPRPARERRTGDEAFALEAVRAVYTPATEGPAKGLSTIIGEKKENTMARPSRRRT